MAAHENAKESGKESSYIALCNVIDHVSPTINKGLQKVLSSIKPEAIGKENNSQVRVNKYMTKAATSIEENIKRISTIKAEFKK